MTRRVTRLRSRRSSAGSSSFGKSTCSVRRALRVSLDALESGLDEVDVTVDELSGGRRDEMREQTKLRGWGREAMMDGCEVRSK
jgi:hypothetical protein